MADLSFKEARQLCSHVEGLRNERLDEWRELCALFLPHRGRFKGETPEGLRERKQYNNHATAALIEAAAMLTSCATPEGLTWFGHDYLDPAMREMSGALEWLKNVDDIIRLELKLGGFYEAIDACNQELLGVGCCLLSVMPGRSKPLIYRCCTVGTYAVAIDRERELDCVVEHEYFTARELVESFGEARCSEATRKAATETPYKMIDVTHMTYVRRQAPMESMASTDMPVGSVWWEPDGRDFLARSGYESMPYFFTVWHDGGRSIYGTGPGDLARCDQRQVNAQELYKSLGLEKMIDPPLAIPGNMAGKIDTTPGARNVVASLQGTQAVMPLYSVDFSRAVQAVQQEIQIVSGRLDDILLRNVFSVPPDELLKGMTATAVVARRRAALQKMGPAINRYESRILSGVIERTYGVLASMGLIPEPPFPEAASPLQISYQSPLAEGLKQSGSDSITAFLQIAQPIIQAVPDCADKVDFDQVLDICARSLAVDPSIIRSDEDVAVIRKQKAEAQRQQMEQERQRQEMQQAAQLGSVKTEGTLAGALMGTNPEAANAGF